MNQKYTIPRRPLLFILPCCSPGVHILHYLRWSCEGDRDFHCPLIRRTTSLASTCASSLCHTAPRYLYDIVANKRNGIDVDKFDYLARDSYFCGVKISFEHSLPMNYSKVSC